MLSQETKDFISSHRDEDPRALALQAKRYPGVDIREAVTQIEGWQIAKEKLPAWAATEGITYPPRLSMEQCSSEPTALYKSKIAKGDSFADLTGGFGIDCSYMSRNFKRAIYIEQNIRLCEIAKENFSLLGLDHISVINGNSEELLATLPTLDWIYIDPARRNSDGHKVVTLSECEPDVTVIVQRLLEKAGNVMIKCSPMLDITAAIKQLHNVEAIHIVAVNNECKELLFILGEPQASETPIVCTNIKKDKTDTFAFTANGEAESDITYSNSVGRYLYEPNAAIQKSGCTRALAQRFNLKKLHPNSQLYTNDNIEENFPGRKFIVEKVTGFTKNEIKEIRALGRANITVRNFPESTQLLRKKLKLADGGENYIFATTLSQGNKVLVVCKKA